MITDFKKFKASIRKSRNIYSIKDRLLGKDRNWVKINEIETDNGGHYKLIQLTESGVKNSKYQDRIENAKKNLTLYAENNGVPKVIYSDSNRLVVDWIDGNPLNSLILGEQDYISLARFIAVHMCSPVEVSLESILKKMDQQLEILSRKGILKKELQDNIKVLLEKTTPSRKNIIECICFDDTSLKNYLRGVNEEFHYIDVFGIGRVLAGRFFVKQLSMIPLEFRQVFADSFLERSSFSEIEPDISFYRLVFLIERICSKSRKTGFIRKIRGNNKVAAAIKSLEEMIHDEIQYSV